MTLPQDFAVSGSWGSGAWRLRGWGLPYPSSAAIWITQAIVDCLCAVHGSERASGLPPASTNFTASAAACAFCPIPFGTCVYHSSTRSVCDVRSTWRSKEHINKTLPTANIWGKALLLVPLLVEQEKASLAITMTKPPNNPPLYRTWWGGGNQEAVGRAQKWKFMRKLSWELKRWEEEK